jgi:hypothetical protein
MTLVPPTFTSRYGRNTIISREISISHFTQSSSKRGDQPAPAHSTLTNEPSTPPTTDPDNGQHAIDVVADFASPSDIVPWSTDVVIDINLYLSGYCNQMHISDTKWTMGDDEQPGAGDFGWDIGFPFAITDQPIEYLQTIMTTLPTYPLQTQTG